MTTAIKLIAGLGNPGPQYENTRHNVGAWFIEQLAAQKNITLHKETKFKGALAKLNNCLLLLPLTFMNNCGEAVQAIASFYKLTPQNILVVHDELDFPAGTIKLKFSGGHGGHNGLRNIINHLSSADFYRLRIGIGHPGHKDLVSDYVLGKPSLADKNLILNSIAKSLAVIDNIIAGKIEQAMQQLHTGE